MSSDTPQNWQTVKFGEILCERKERSLNNGKFPLYSLTIADGVSPKSARYEREFLVSNTDTKTYKIVNANDLVFNPANLRWGAIARAKIPLSVLVSPIYEILYPKDKNVLNPVFLEYLAKSDHLHLEYLHYMEGTLVERTALKIDDFLNLTVNVPPLPEQKRIATILTSVDEVIETTQKQIDKLQDLKKVTMNELMTKGIGHTEFKDSELGRIPKSWSVKRLDEVAINHDSQRVPIKSEDRQNIQGVYRYYGASGIIDYVENYIFDGRYILLGEDGENVLSRNLPLAFIVEGKFWVNNHAHILQPNEQMDIGFLCEYLESLDYKNIASGSAQPKITKSALNHIRVKIPPRGEQDEIVKMLSSMDETLKSIKEKLSQTQSLKKSLMQDLLTGKVRVKVN
jgi:type I restriction enzyme, S subunit